MEDYDMQEHVRAHSEQLNGALTSTVHESTQFDGTEEEEERRYLNPSRWWFAQVAFPLLAGTAGPLANAFNILALGQYWRETFTTDEDSGVLIKDPAWLLVVNAVSLACGLAGNASLLLNMANALSFNIAQPITVSGFFGASILLIGIVAQASTNSFHQHGVPGSALTQAYYYAAFAAGIYFIVGCLMLVTISGAIAKKYDSEFNLTPSQRTLMLQTIVFLGYLMIGALIFSHVEGWTYLDAVYWADFTLLTVGLGAPYVPMTHAGRSLIFVFAMGGIVAIGLVVGSIRSMVLEQGKQKLSARLTEKRREHIAKRATRAVQANLDEWKKLHPKDIRRLEFHAMKQIQVEVSTRAKWRSLVLSLTAAASLWFIGALIFSYTEYEQQWSYFESVYFAFVVLTTIGYGDFAPTSNSGKAFFVLWTLLAVPTLTIFISDLGETVVKGIVAATDFIGKVTFLPGKEGFRGALRVQNSEIPLRPVKHLVAQRLDLDSLTNDLEREASMVATGEETFTMVLKMRLDEQDLKYCTELKDSDQHDPLAKDTRFFHWLLVKESRRVKDDCESSGRVQYTYDEWVYFLNLLGHDEASTENLKRPPTLQPKRAATGYELGKITDRHGNIRDWSWLGIRSPLMSANSESEWILHQLMNKLHHELHPQKLLDPQMVSTPPISLASLQ